MAIKINGTVVVDNSRNITNATNGDFAGTVTATLFEGYGAIPPGAIVMWSGTIANIPNGWALCDGNNGTPDLRNRFIVGAHSGTGDGTVPTSGPGFLAATGTLNRDYRPGDTGGSTAHQLTEAQMPPHSHTYQAQGTSGNNFSFGGGYSIGFESSTGATGGNRYHENRPPYYALAFIMFRSDLLIPV